MVPVAQRQSASLWRKMLWVRNPSGTLKSLRIVGDSFYVLLPSQGESYGFDTCICLCSADASEVLGILKDLPNGGPFLFMILFRSQQFYLMIFFLTAYLEVTTLYPSSNSTRIEFILPRAMTLQGCPFLSGSRDLQNQI
jgi:hypothetical protein